MRFLTANYIFADHTPAIPNGILVTKNDGTVLGVFKRKEEVFAAFPKLQKRNFKLEFYKGFLCPGFVNAHCHLELSYLKGKIKPGGGITSFIKQLIEIRNNFSAKEIQDAIKTADKEMYDEGIVAVGDISNGDATFKLKAKSKIYYHTFIEAFDLKPEKATQAFLVAQGLMAQLKKSAPENCNASIVPHAPYTVTQKLFKLINVYPHNNIVSIHSQESEGENKLFKVKKGVLYDFFLSMGNNLSHVSATRKSSVYYILSLLNKTKRILFVHNTFTNRNDVRFIVSEKPLASLCLCPNANLFIEGKLPDVNLLFNNHANLCVGTDSLASNKQLSVMEEIKVIASRFKKIPIEEVIGFATYSGAWALNIENKYGTFCKGMKPGVVHIANTKGKKFTAKSFAKRAL